MNQRSAGIRCVTGLAVWMTVAACGESPRAPEGVARQTAKQALDTKPDFVVTAVTGPTSMRNGTDFMATATVCNQGTQGGSTHVALYLSEDAIIVPLGGPEPSPDFEASMRLPTDYLAPGQCQTVTLSGSADVSEGAYYLGTFVDMYGDSDNEISENNNTQVGTIVSVLP